eukprot:2551786-Prymnesium_polylepis.1
MLQQSFRIYRTCRLWTWSASDRVGFTTVSQAAHVAQGQTAGLCWSYASDDRQIADEMTPTARSNAAMNMSGCVTNAWVGAGTGLGGCVDGSANTSGNTSLSWLGCKGIC